ncbi:MAG: RNA polymerase-binding protein DksA [Deltaproteobacteria bacterium]|nr:RNA polymerase-binding protein DksA [Deltaproteobacteria bacterium]
MEPEKLEYYRKLLHQRMDELFRSAETTVTGMTDTKENFPDPTDRAALESDRNFLLRIRDRERKLIQKIREALLRIDEGTFGICERCGEPISDKRLEARPVTTLCIECKERQEAVEKARGL